MGNGRNIAMTLSTKSLTLSMEVKVLLLNFSSRLTNIHYFFPYKWPDSFCLSVCKLTGLPLYLSWQRICLQCRRTLFDSWVWKFLWRRDRLPTSTSVFLGFTCGSAGKESSCNGRNLGLIPGFGRSPEGRHGSLLQGSCLENPSGSRGWQDTVHGVRKSCTWLGN